MSAIFGFGKTNIVRKLCKMDQAETAMGIFLDIQAQKDAIITAGCEIFKVLYQGKPPKDLGDLRFEIFSKHAAAGNIRAEKLPPTTAAAPQHSLHAYLQTQRLATATKSISGCPELRVETGRRRLCTSPYHRPHCPRLSTEIHQLQL